MDPQGMPKTEEVNRARHGRRLGCRRCPSRRVRAATTRVLPDGKKHTRTAAQTEAIHRFRTSTSNDFSSYVDTSHNDSVTRTTMSNRHTAQNKSRSYPFLSRKRFSQGERFCLPRPHGTHPAPRVTGRRTGHPRCVSHIRLGKASFNWLAVLSIG